MNSEDMVQCRLLHPFPFDAKRGLSYLANGKFTLVYFAGEILKALVSKSCQIRKTCSILIAAKSWRRRMVGFFARMFDGVPVERPQDITRVGTGTLSVSAEEPEVLIPK